MQNHKTYPINDTEPFKYMTYDAIMSFTGTNLLNSIFETRLQICCSLHLMSIHHIDMHRPSSLLMTVFYYIWDCKAAFFSILTNNLPLLTMNIYYPHKNSNGTESKAPAFLHIVIKKSKQNIYTAIVFNPSSTL